MPLLPLLLGLASACQAAPSFQALKPSANRVERLDRYELSFQLKGAAYKNPFDPAQIDVTARFQSPSGRSYEVPAFFHQEFTRSGPPEVLSPSGAPHWRLRFTPDEAGNWRVELKAKDSATGLGKAGPFGLQVIPSGRKAWPKPSKKDPAYLSFEDGSPYIPLGQNMGWGDWGMKDGTYAYDKWLGKMAAQGGNFARIWMWSQAHGIEWNDTGLGNYSKRLNQAWRLDTAIEAARRQGVQVMLMLLNHGSVSTVANSEWKDNPYNVANGGPCQKPRDFFTHPKARDLFKRRLRYTAARWGWQPNITLELANEIDNLDDYIKDPAVASDVASWHRDMAKYLSGLAPKPMLTTSFSRYQNDPAIWSIPEISLTQFHLYTNSQAGEDLQADIIARYRERFPTRPVFGGEMGFHPGGDYSRAEDPKGLHWHNAQWASMFSGACGSSALWWWPDYIEPQNLYTFYRGLSNFFKGLDLSTQGLKPVRPGVESPQLGGLFLTPYGEWGLRAEAGHYELSPSGRLTPGLDRLAGYLYDNTWNSSRRNPPTFKVNFSQPVKLAIKLGPPNSEPKFEASLDGQVIHNAVPVKDSTVTLDIPAGFHRLALDNKGTGWVEIESLEFLAAVPALKSYALQGPNLILAWVMNRDYHHQRLKQGPPPPASGRLSFDKVKNGRWQAEWWDTVKGIPTARAEVRAKSGKLNVDVPATAWDRALKLRFTGP